MKEMIQAVLDSRGIYVSEEDCKILVEQWQAIQDLKGDLKGTQLREADIALRHIPIGGEHSE